MRVLMICTSSRHDVGGMEAVFRAVGHALAEQGHTVTVAYTEEANEQIDEQTWAVRLESPRTRWKMPVLASVLRMSRSLITLARILRRARPDVVNVHFITAHSFYFYLLRPLFGYRIVLSAHGSDVLRPSSQVDRVLLPRLFRGADAVTVVSDALADRVHELTGGSGPQPVVIANGVDLGFWSPDENGVRGAAHPTVLAVGRLHPVKGHDILLHAVKRVRDHVSAVRLRLIGDGVARSETAALIEELGLHGNVDLVGEASADTVRAELRRSSVFALPSRSEGMPISLLEAMATGCAVVASRVGGIPEVLANDVGLMVPPEDSEALAEAILSLLQNPSLRADYSRKGLRRAADFSWASSAAAYSELITRK